jgi:hypothetical protein
MMGELVKKSAFQDHIDSVQRTIDMVDGEMDLHMIQGEPHVHFGLDIKSGLYCLVLRSVYGGFFCGYVIYDGERIPDAVTDNFVIHGGVTLHDDSAFLVDRILADRPEFANMNVIGFDCAHASDFNPFTHGVSLTGSTYRNFEYVVNETRYLAHQVKEAMTYRLTSQEIV